MSRPRCFQGGNFGQTLAAILDGDNSASFLAKYDFSCNLVCGPIILPNPN